MPEKLFNSMLARERRRCQRSGHPFGVVSIDLSAVEYAGADLEPATPGLILDRLRDTVRETDLVGWYRAQRVAGAILTELGNASFDTVSEAVAARLTHSLSDCLPDGSSRRLHIDIDFFHRKDPERSGDEDGKASPKAEAGKISRHRKQLTPAELPRLRRRGSLAAWLRAIRGLPGTNPAEVSDQTS